MKDPAFRDNLLTLIMLSGVSAVYLFLVFLPGQRQAAQVKREIVEAEQGIQEVPLRVAELESLQRDVDRRSALLDEVRPLVPAEPDEHAVVARVARLAEQARLRVTRLEPLPVVRHESYEVHPYRLSVGGDFRGLVAFINDLEGEERLYSVEDLTVAREAGTSGKQAQADMHFSVFSRRATAAGSAEETRSSVRAGDDRQRR